MDRNIDLYPSLSIYVNGDQMNSGEMNGGQTNGDQLNSSQSVTGDMNGDQINSGQMNGGQTNGVQLISNQSVGGQMNRDQFNSGQMNGGQTNGCQMKSSQSVAHQMNGNQINSGQMNGDQTNGGQLINRQQVGGRLINSQQVGGHMVGDQRNIGRMNGNQMNGSQLSSSQNVGGHMKGDQINSGQMNGGQEQRCFIWSRGQMNTARDLNLEHSEKYENWKWELDSRFTEVAEPLKVWGFSIKARRNFLGLSANTKYGAYLIFRTKKDSEGLDELQKATISVGRKELTKYVYLKPPTATLPGVGLPVERSDRWMELELGQFECDYVNGDKDAVIRIEETKTDNKKTGLIVAGIEIRPI